MENKENIQIKNWSGIVTLNPAELVKWCKVRKKELSLSNQDIADKTGVPAGTIDRIFSGNYSEFRYSSIQPVIAYLIGFNKDTPEPEDEESEQAQYYYNTIEGYKLIVENKNHEINQLTLQIEKLSKEVEFLKRENEGKASLLSKNAELLKEEQALLARMQGTIEILAKK